MTDKASYQKIDPAMPNNFSGKNPGLTPAPSVGGSTYGSAPNDNKRSGNDKK